MIIHFTVLEGSWRHALPAAEKLARRAVAAALKSLRRKGGEITIAAADDKTIQQINRRFRGKNKPTNVLAFPSPPAIYRQRQWGDIIVSLSTLKKEAKAHKKTLEQHFVHLIVHGFLHLLGYDHMTEEEAIAMERKEVLILTSLGYSDPYKS